MKWFPKVTSFHCWGSCDYLQLIVITIYKYLAFANNQQGLNIIHSSLELNVNLVTDHKWTSYPHERWRRRRRGPPTPTPNSNPQDSTTLQKNPLECYFWKDNGRMAITCLRLCLHAFTGFITLPGQTVEKHMLGSNQEPLLGHEERRKVGTHVTLLLSFKGHLRDT